jgi:hypothetical protein
MRRIGQRGEAAGAIAEAVAYFVEQKPRPRAEVSGKEKAADSWAALSLTAGLALVVMTLDNASVPSIGRHAECPRTRARNH